ncbi:MAG TPA: DUF3857 domain-containing protein [Gammaproteobacteria bacterium]|nr:DUF3857 domain-containing protein [Gammaproteobacteria bacterium]
MIGPKQRAARRIADVGRGAVFLLLGLTAVRAAAQSDPPLYAFDDPASWIEVREPDYAAADAAAHSKQGAWFLLFDRQIDVTDRGDDYYQHVAVEATDASAVADFSQFNLTVDPSYQSLVVHRLRVVRNGDVIDERGLARITALPQETELSNRVYNGRYNVNVLLSDVRVGDVVEMSYTVRSIERIFPGHFATRLGTGWTMPLHRQFIRVRWPAARALRYRMTDGSAVPEPRAVGKTRELAMQWTDVAPVAVEAAAPSWYDPWAYLEISDLESWKDVSRLVRPLFSMQGRARADVGALAKTIAAQGGTSLDQALRALQFVQEEIRYTSIAIGRGSFEPADPDTVLQRRFGDCKDKSLLLAALLNRLGIEAEPALVHSSRGRLLPDALPTPYAFDHAIVRASIGGNLYWLDATEAKRYSPLSPATPADFENALPIGGSDGLEAIPRPARAASRQYVTTSIDLRDAKAATLTITTRYSGVLADAVRPVLARGTAEQRRADYARYITQYYPSAQPAGPISIHDDQTNNVVETRESYRLDRSFEDNEDGRPSFMIYANELYPYGNALGIGSRNAPLAVAYPVNVHQQILARLPHEWSVRPETWQVDDPAFRFRGEAAYSNRTLRLDYEYVALADYVEPADLVRYQTDRDRVLDTLAYVLTDKPSASGRLALAPGPLLAILLALGLGIWAAVRWGYRYDPAPLEALKGAPAGIGGWLLLPAIGAAVGPLVSVWAVAAWAPLVEAATWYSFPSLANEAYRPWAHAAVLAIVTLTVLLLIGSVLTSILFFKKRTSAPAAFIALNWLTVVFSAGVILWTSASGFDDSSDAAVSIGGITRDVVVTLAWTLYMLRSERVKATFVRRLRSPAVAERAALPDAAPP